MQRNSPFAESEFDREWRRARRFHRVFSIVVLSLIALIFVGTATAIYKVVTEPEIVGEFVGKMVSGYETEAR